MPAMGESETTVVIAKVAVSTARADVARREEARPSCTDYRTHQNKRPSGWDGLFVYFLRGGSTLIGMCGAVLMTGRGPSSGARLRIVSSSRKNFSASIATTSLAAESAWLGFNHPPLALANEFVEKG